MLLEQPAPPGYRFELRYVHSAFRIPVREIFTVDGAGRLVLREIRSTRADIVDYYHIPGARVVDRPGDVRIVGLALPHRRLLVRAGPIGNRTFHDGRCELPLAELAGAGGRLTLAVAYRPWLPILLHRRGIPCPKPTI
ncbi:MAG: DUF1850 domain-containing protein [Firmicutes bacterium]|nr:DUF1850 domain-containing protein [Bacillota bacterium]